MEIRDYLRIARRRWLLIWAAWWSPSVSPRSSTFRATPLYSSSTQLFVSTPGSDTSQAYQGSLFSQQRVTSYADLVTSRKVAERVLDEVDSDLTPTQLTAKVTAPAVPETVILEISVSDPDPETAQALAQAYAKADDRLHHRARDAAGEARADQGHRRRGGRPAERRTRRSRCATSASPPCWGCCWASALAVLREILDNTIKSPADVTAVADTPVMSTVALDPQAEKKPLITEISSHAPRAEAFRVLRTNLQFVDVDSSSKIIAVTSSVPGEGKTSTATNLAIALAQAGQRTLLLDGDLRRPRSPAGWGWSPPWG